MQPKPCAPVTKFRIIRGGWQLAGGHDPVDAAEQIEDMIAFADAGITTFDCADIYTALKS